MKKHLLGIVSLAVLAVGLASCTGESSLGSSSNSSISVSTPDSSFTPDSSDSSASDYPEVTISLSTTEISLDVGGVLSLRATVAGETEDSTVDFTVDDPTIVSLSTPTGSIRTNVTALAEGTATITATAHCNPNVSATCVVTVSPAKPTLRAQVASLVSAHNYTVTSTYSGEAMLAELTDTVQLTEDSLIVTSTTSEGTSGIWNGKLIYDDDDPLASSSVYGLSVADDGQVFYVAYTESGEFVSPALRAKGGSGYLTAENFDGSGSSTPIENDFNSFASFDPSVFTDEKSTDNTYEIAGDYESDGETLNSDVSVEVGLINAFAPNLYLAAQQAVVGEDGTFYLVDVALLIDTTLEVTDDGLTMTFESSDLGMTVKSVVSNVGTTTITTAPASFASDVANVEVETPALNSELQAIITAINANDYVNSGNYWFGVEGTNFTATDYYTEDYYISSLTNYAGYQGIATYLELKGEEVTPENVSSALGSAVFYKGDDGYVKSRQIILTPVTNEEGVTSLTYVIGEEKNATTTSGGTVTNDLYYQACGYYSSYGVFNETTFSVFSDEREIFFSSLGSTYNSRSYATGELFAQVFGVYDQILRELGGDPAVYATVVDPTIDRQTGACTDVTFYVAFGADTSGSYQLYQFDITGFGEGSDNPLADQLADLL